MEPVSLGKQEGSPEVSVDERSWEGKKVNNKEGFLLRH